MIAMAWKKKGKRYEGSVTNDPFVGGFSKTARKQRVERKMRGFGRLF